MRKETGLHFDGETQIEFRFTYQIHSATGRTTPNSSWFVMTVPNPVRVSADDTCHHEILSLVQTSFAYMDARINPPSSMKDMTAASIREQCQSGEVWTIGKPPQACLFLKIRDSSLYLSKLSVAEEMRGSGLARRLIDLAADRARFHRVPSLELETRIELHENHETFKRLGFLKIAERSHPGFCTPTYIVMQKHV